LSEHRDLHSFPTRRSSDLSWRILNALLLLEESCESPTDQKFGMGESIEYAFPAKALKSSKLLNICVPFSWRERRGLRRYNNLDEDRKSTRLNSSHVAISYA